MSINEYQRVRIRPKNEVEADQKQTRSRPEADQKHTRSTPEADPNVKCRSRMTGILCQPKDDYQNCHCEII